MTANPQRVAVERLTEALALSREPIAYGHEVVADRCVKFVRDHGAALLQQLAEQAAEITELRAKVFGLELGHETALETIRMGQDLLSAFANDMRAAGCDVVREPLSIVNTRAEAAERAREEAMKLAAAVLAHRHGDLPTLGYLRDNDASRLALANLAAFLAANGGGRED